VRFMLVPLAALALAACGGGESQPRPVLEGSPPDCAAVKLYPDVLECNPEIGVALSQSRSHWTIWPIAVTSLEDWRDKRDKGFELYRPLLEARDVDLCFQVGVNEGPDAIQAQLERPKDLHMPGCPGG